MINAAHRGIQSNFILNIPEENLGTNNIVFTVKRIIQSFLEEYEFLLENDKKRRGKAKNL